MDVILGFRVSPGVPGRTRSERDGEVGGECRGGGTRSGD